MSGDAKMPLPVQGSGQIDLDSNAVIEASAGTGKTYTIAELVVSLLRKGRVQGLDEILVVTFTEKAAGELKDRIRAIIIESLEKDASEILKISLDNFDSASIFTIHGFCNKILSEYAFENRAQFQNELADDREVYREMLRRIMREKWPAKFGDRLHSILKLSNFPDLAGDGTSRWEERVIEIALRYQPSGGDRLIPVPAPDLFETIRKMEETCCEYLDGLSRLVGPVDEDDVGRSECCARYAGLNIRKNSMNKRLRILTSVLRLIAAHRKKEASLPDVAFGIDNPDIGENGFHELISGWTTQGADYEEKLPQLEEIVRLLEKLRAIDFTGVQNMLAAFTISEIKNLSSEFKNLRGLMSYDDMVGRVCAALADRSGNLTRIVRNRYRYAFVDEFQDTDLLQWNIFKTVFLGTERNRLFIISDPKQAIYGFRGADVNAYYIARGEMIRLYGARYYSLMKNWRSSKKLIEVFNQVFGSGTWFAESNIAYLPSDYPEEKDPKTRREEDCLVVMDCGECTGTEAKFKTADYIAREIRRLSARGARVAPGDIAILVKKWSEADTVERSLKKAGIRYSYYKKEGLFQSKEALEICYLLSSIARPNDVSARRKSLATRFFGVPVQALRRFDDLPADHSVSLLFSRWRSYSDRKNWPHLFQSIMEDTGVLYRTETAGPDRSIINYRSLIQYVQVKAAEENYSILDIVDFLNDTRLRGVLAHESHNLEKIDIENPGVQLMTIHASKGLQFRAVFIAGGFTRRDIFEFWTYHQDGSRIFDLVQAKDRRPLHEREMSGEEERLFYVAFTRAAERVYVPVFRPTRASRGSSGILGDKLPLSLEAARGKEGVSWIECGSVNYQEEVNGSDVPGGAEAIELPDPLFYGHEMDFLGRMIPVDSFSGLKSRLFQQKIEEDRSIDSGDAGPLSGEDDVSFIAETDGVSIDYQEIDELPHSLETGLLLHDILEKIDYRHIDQARSPIELLAPNSQSGKIIAVAVQAHAGIVKSDSIEFARGEAARIVWNTLRTPLNGADLVLCKVDKKIHEAEFYYPTADKEEGAIPGISYPDGYLRGFIDLVFSHKGRLYIADWKSNYLEQGYSLPELENNIRDMRYDLQIAIYSAALIRWLKLNLPCYSYETHFGGVYYLYLRGMDPGVPGNGIFFYRPDEEHEIMSVLRL
jgi:exodeoxyribonuclease V beta subunit